MSTLIGMTAAEPKQADMPEWEDLLNSLREAEAKVSITILDEKRSKLPAVRLPKDEFVLWKIAPVAPEKRSAAVMARKALGASFSAASMEKRFPTATAAEKIDMFTLGIARLLYLGPYRAGSVFIIQNDGKQPTIVSQTREMSKQGDRVVCVDKIGNFGSESSVCSYLGTAPLTAEDALALARLDHKVPEAPEKKDSGPGDK